MNIIETQLALPCANTILEQGLEQRTQKKRTTLGKVDVFFSINRKRYIGEIKSLGDNGSFWYATKALAYSKYYNWCSGESSRPAVIIPKDEMRFEFQIIAGMLKMEIFVFEILKKDVKIYMVGNEPYWKNMGWGY
jgi:hypothetical protein